MKIGITKEIAERETRVAMTPANVTVLTKKGVEIMVQAGAGTNAGYPDSLYQDAGATLVDSREQVITDADVNCQVQSFGCHSNTDADLALLKKDQIVIGMMDPRAAPAANQPLAEKGGIPGLQRAPRRAERHVRTGRLAEGERFEHAVSIGIAPREHCRKIEKSPSPPPQFIHYLWSKM